MSRQLSDSSYFHCRPGSITFECILGADFLKANKAVMDFRNNTLHLGNSKIKIPSSDVSVSSDDAHSISVHALEDMDILVARCVWSLQLCRKDLVVQPSRSLKG